MENTKNTNLFFLGALALIAVASVSSTAILVNSNNNTEAMAITAPSQVAAVGGATNLPSSKATAAINTAVGCTVSNVTNIDTAPMSCRDIFSGAVVPVAADNFVTVMKVPVKVSNSQSLFVSPSLVTGLYTDTTTVAKRGTVSKTTAEGGVFMRAVLMNRTTGAILRIADPVGACKDGILGCQLVGQDYGVVLNSRVQTISQSLSNCVVSVGDLSGTCEFDSTVQLVLKTTSAHSFNFIFPEVGQGVYDVAVQVAVNSNATLNTGTGAVISAAAFGLGSLTVESVRLTHNFEF